VRRPHGLLALPLAPPPGLHRRGPLVPVPQPRALALAVSW